ncbi:MAG: hypothetical protein H8E20_10485 [Verrucomicrobia bacterium]|nr:hypothetical protein [Verrucomicrobiota bacterium]
MLAVGFAGIALGAETGSPGIARVYLQGGQVLVEARFPASAEVRLRRLRPHAGSGEGRELAPDWHRSGGSATASLTRLDGKADIAFCRFQLVDHSSGTRLGQARWVDNVESAARHANPFPVDRGIKGLQCIEDIDDALRLGIKQAALNVTLDQLVDWRATSGRFSRPVDGGAVYFHAGYVAHIDSQLKRLTDVGVANSLIIYNRIPGSRSGSPLVHPGSDLAKSPFHVGAFNLATEEGVRAYRGAIEFLAQRYSDPEDSHGLAKRFIIGNELQSHWHWYNLGEMPRRQVVEEYHKALRVAHLAAHGIHPGIELYISLDHHWSAQMGGNPFRGMPGRYFIETLNTIVKAAGNFDWHVAFHPYPENLFDPRTWEDSEATASFDTKKITFKNIQILPAFLRQKRFLLNGKPRRVILSEQGFHSADGVRGESDQAAAYAYAYYRVRHTAGIDAFILHRHVDHPGEGGLRLGLRRRRNGGERQIYEVFRRADTAEWADAFRFALPVIGADAWPEILPDPTDQGN